MRGIRDRKEIKQIIERELVKGNQHEIIKGEMCFKDILGWILSEEIITV